MTHDEMERRIRRTASLADALFVVVLLALAILVLRWDMTSRTEASHSLHHPDCAECFEKGAE